MSRRGQHERPPLLDADAGLAARGVASRRSAARAAVAAPPTSPATPSARAPATGPEGPAGRGSIRSVSGGAPSGPPGRFKSNFRTYCANGSSVRTDTREATRLDNDSTTASRSVAARRTCRRRPSASVILTHPGRLAGSATFRRKRWPHRGCRASTMVTCATSRSEMAAACSVRRSHVRRRDPRSHHSQRAPHQPQGRLAPPPGGERKLGRMNRRARIAPGGPQATPRAPLRQPRGGAARRAGPPCGLPGRSSPLDQRNRRYATYSRASGVGRRVVTTHAHHPACRA
jgi:hypothetical protein